MTNSDARKRQAGGGPIHPITGRLLACLIPRHVYEADRIVREALDRQYLPTGHARPAVNEHYVVNRVGALNVAICGKTWTAGQDVRVVGRCPDCLHLKVDGEWEA